MKKILLAFMLLFLPSIASAGTVTVNDSAGVISSDQVTALRSLIGTYQFDLKVFTSSFMSRRDLESAVSDCVTSPNVVCSGVDPTHRWTSTHFGTATGVRPSDFNIISAAGNQYFKSGNYAAAFRSIADRASESARSTQQTVQVNVPPPQVVSQTTGVSAFFLVLLFAGLSTAAYVIYRLAKRQKRLDRDMGSYREERDEYMNANVDRMTQPSPTVRQSTYRPPTRTTTAPAVTPVVVQQAAAPNNDLLTGVLIGQMTSRPTEVIREREIVRETAPASSTSKSYASSDDYSSSTSSDSGGGSSSYDSGGGFDSGGGGFDSGGGGSDF